MWIHLWCCFVCAHTLHSSFFFYNKKANSQKFLFYCSSARSQKSKDRKRKHFVSYLSFSWWKAEREASNRTPVVDCWLYCIDESCSALAQADWNVTPIIRNKFQLQKASLSSWKHCCSCGNNIQQCFGIGILWVPQDPTKSSWELAVLTVIVKNKTCRSISFKKGWSQQMTLKRRLKMNGKKSGSSGLRWHTCSILSSKSQLCFDAEALLQTLRRNALKFSVETFRHKSLFIGKSLMTFVDDVDVSSTLG